MSQTTVNDPYLATEGAKIPVGNNLTVDPQFGSIRLVTPIGRLSYVTLVTPKQVKQPGGGLGQPIFSATLLMNPVATTEIYKAIVAVATHRFPSETRPDPRNPSGPMVQMTAEQMLFLTHEQGGLHYPLRAGDSSYMRDPKRYDQWRGLFFVNASIAATSASGQSQKPVCKDEAGRDCDPSVIYSGCYGRMQLTFFAYPKPGAQSAGGRGVGVSLNAVQFARHGERMGGFDASKAAELAFAGAGAIAPDPTAVNYGPNSATAGSVPPQGGAPAGFAAPPIAPNQNPAGTAPAYTPQGGARPPGV